MDRQREIEGERAKCRTLFLLRLASSLFALLSLPSSFLPFSLQTWPLSPSFPLSAIPGVRPGQKTRPRDARCFLESVRPPPRPISRRNGKARRISMSGERILRREAGWMRWLSQKLTAKIDRPVAVLPFVLPSSSAATSEKEQKRRCRCFARSLARFVRSFVLSPPPLEKIAVAAFFYGSGRIVVGAFSELRIINFGMDALSPNNLMKYNTFIFCH